METEENTYITLPFEKYTYSCVEDEYKKDIKKKTIILKYIDLLVVNPEDTVSLSRLFSLLIVLKNTFCKESCLEYFLQDYNEEQIRLIAKILYDMFVVDSDGSICEYKEFLDLSIKLNNLIDYKNPITRNWYIFKNKKI